ncbi:MAG: toll/interleukin-1 receptor domain-containing protein [Anaerolineae bacterium]
MPDVFISYSRKNKAFVEKLVKSLEDKGRDVWVDFQDIPFAAEWWDEIQNGIESSSSAVFVISPDYLSSEVCGLEVNYVQKNKKRIVPIVYVRPDQTSVPSTLAELNWIFFDDPNAFDDSFLKLSTTLDTNLEEMASHTRLLVKAREWEKAGHRTSLLLRGEELAELEKVLNNPASTELMRQFVFKSQEQRRVEEMALRFIWGFFGGLLGIAFWAFSTFRSDILFSPQRVVYSIALGQVFGISIGVLSMLADEMPNRVLKWIPSKPMRLVLRTFLFLGIGIFAWTSYIWFLERLDTTRENTQSLLLGGVMLAAGFLARSLKTHVPGWAFSILIAAFIWLSIYITFNDNYVNFVPLVYFDNPNQVWSIGFRWHSLWQSARTSRHYKQKSAHCITGS